MKVQRGEPELVTPAEPTRHEFKPLSDLDDQDGFRFHVPLVFVYPHRPYMQGVDPAKVIKEAVAKALVFYYPLAGRQREVGPTRKLMVECNAEGVLFVEADADITLQESGDSLLPPFPYLDEFLFNVPSSDGVLNCSLLLIQVTRLKCGGFVWAIGLNHTMADAFGLKQFMSAVGEFARGKQVPSIMPVWERHIFCASNSPNPTLSYPKYGIDQSVQLELPLDHFAHQSFFFGYKQLYILRKSVALHFDRCSNFELITACMWKCRTIALQPEPTEIMSMICLVNARNRFNPPLVPHGYYGNCFLLSTVTSTAEDLIKMPLEYAVGLIKKAKNNVTKEYIQSTVDTLVIKGRPMIDVEGTYVMSDNIHSGFGQVDIGWGNATYGGPPRSTPMASFLIQCENKKGENGMFVPICLPIEAMEIFVKEINNILEEKSTKSSL